MSRKYLLNSNSPYIKIDNGIKEKIIWQDNL